MKTIIYLILVSSLTTLTTNLWAAGDATQGKINYDKFCMQCHGATGAGDGPVGLALPEGQKPASFQAAAFKFATDLSKFKELLAKGGAAVGLNPLMPPQAGLTDADIENLYAYVNTLKK